MFIRTTRPSDKLNFTKLEPPKIVKILELIKYKLDLLVGMWITQIRYILIFELADPEASLVQNILDINPKSQEKVWEVKKILDTGLINSS